MRPSGSERPERGIARQNGGAPAVSAAPIGITKGPGETIHEYTFISRDESRLLKNGE